MEDGAISELSARSFSVASRRVQLLSHGSMLAADLVPPVNPRFEELVKSPFFLIGLLVGWIIVRLLATWAASKAVMRNEQATFGRSAVLLVAQIIFFIGLGIVVALLIPITARLQDTWRQAVVSGAVLIIALIVAFKIPMKVYGIGFWRGFALMFCAGAVESMVLYSVQWATGMPTLTPDHIASLKGERSPLNEVWGRVMAESAAWKGGDEIDRLLDEAEELTELSRREAAVRVLQAKLGERKLSLVPGETEAAAKFERQLDRYLRFLNEVKAERGVAGAGVRGF
jgi:hypothetical protein